MTEENDEKLKKDYEEMGDDKFQRRQKITIEQMTFATSILFGISTAILGFSIDLLIGENFKIETISFVIGCLSIIASIGFAIRLTINRLNDFRKTTKTTNKKTDWEEKKCLRCETRKLGERTWCLFHWQIGTFIIGILATIISITITYSNKLF